MTFFLDSRRNINGTLIELKLSIFCSRRVRNICVFCVKAKAIKTNQNSTEFHEISQRIFNTWRMDNQRRL